MARWCCCEPAIGGLIGERSVMMIGDSIGEGLRGEVNGGPGHGGIRPLLQVVETPSVDARTLIRYVGRNTDPAGYHHECVGGRTFAQIAADFPAAWAANQADEVWLLGAAINDQIAGFTAAQIATNLGTTIQAIRAVVGPSIPIRVGGAPGINAGGDAVLLAYNLLAQNVCDVENANGPVEWCAYGFEQWTFANPPVFVGASDDGIVVEHPRDALGYSAQAMGLRKHLSGANALPMTGVGGTLQMYFDGALVVLTGGAVSQWTDQSGFGRHATQAVAAQRPTPSTLLGRPSVLFSAAGGGTFVRTALTGAFANPWILVVCGAMGNNNGCLYDSANVANRNALFGSGGTNQTSLFAGATINTAINPQLRPRAYLIHWTANGQQIYVGGEKREVINAGAQLLDGMTIGATVTGLLPAQGQIARVAVWTNNPDPYAIHQRVKADFPGIIAPFG